MKKTSTPLLILILSTACANTVADDGDHMLTPEETAKFASNLGVSAEALGTPISYTKINSNNGAPMCTVQNNQCVPIQSLGQRAHRALRGFVQSRNPGGGPNAWTCLEGGQQCSHKSGGRRAAVGLCTPEGRCQFGEPPNYPEGEVRLDAEGRFALFYFNDGGFGQTNPAGNTFWYSPPN